MVWPGLAGVAAPAAVEVGLVTGGVAAGAADEELPAPPAAAPELPLLADVNDVKVKRVAIVWVPDAPGQVLTVNNVGLFTSKPVVITSLPEVRAIAQSAPAAAPATAAASAASSNAPAPTPRNGWSLTSAATSRQIARRYSPEKTAPRRASADFSGDY
ncbi:MAG: hypothetical protein ACKOTE_00510, partial [Opitutaceae bacterium]